MTINFYKFKNLKKHSENDQQKRHDEAQQPVRRRRQTDPLPPIPDDNFKPPKVEKPKEQPQIPTRSPTNRMSSELPPIPEPKLKAVSSATSITKRQQPILKTSSDSYKSSNKDVNFLIQIKDDKRLSGSKFDNESTTTETTLVDKKESELREENEFLKRELEGMKTRCERVEREKSDILLR